MISRCALLFLSLFTLPSGLLADDSVSNVPDYFVAPVTTDLQRSLVRKGTTIYAEVNGDALVKEDAIVFSSLADSAFLGEIKKSWSSDASLYLMCKFQLTEKSAEPALQKEVAAKLKQLCEDQGISNVGLVSAQSSASWSEQWPAYDATIIDDHAQESLTEDDYVQVYPVQTTLSKHLVGNCDCYVSIVPSIDGRMTGELPTELKNSIVTNVKGLHLKHKGKLLFELNGTAAGDRLVEPMFSAKQAPIEPKLEFLKKEYQSELAAYKPSSALTLAKELGFESVGYRYSPNGGAPEKLIGQRCPDFALEGLNGETLELHKFITGRPAIVTFWGLSCGPCRLEAPHLSQLLTKYGNDKLAIVAVNSYKDKKDDVQEYVDGEKLTHAFVLAGHEICHDAYHVAAYPTTFWIDQRGTVVDYEVGFASAAILERKTNKLFQ